jgi:osmoprotectant transport system substrate-binding protein
MKKILMICLVMSLMVMSVGCGGGGGEEQAPIAVSSKAWTEQLILGNITLQYLEAKGYAVEDRTGLGDTQMLRPAMDAGEIDTYWEYTGTTLMVNMESEVITDPKACYDAVKAWDKENNNVTWLDPGAANNTYVLMVRDDFAKEHGINTISDLGDYIKGGNTVVFGSNINFLERKDGIEGVEGMYGFTFDRDNVKSMSAGLTYEALKNGQLDVAMGFGTDGRIPAMNLKVLEDNMQFFPVYNPAPIIRQEVLDANPNLAADLNALAAVMTDEILQEMNKQVDVDQMEPEEVATEFLKAQGFIE